MDKRLITRRFARAMGTYEQEAKMQSAIAQHMVELLTSYVPLSCKNLLEIGCGTGIYSRLLFNRLHPTHMLLNDLCGDMKECCKDLLVHAEVCFLPGDAESIDMGRNWQLITSCSTFQWFENLEDFFSKSYEMLDNRGYLAFSTFGPDNLRELRCLTGNGLFYYTLSELIDKLKSLFRVVYAGEEHWELNFPSSFDVLRHLKRTGVTAVSSMPLLAKDVRMLCEKYQKIYGRGTQGVPVTYHPIYIIVQKGDF